LATVYVSARTKNEFIVNDIVSLSKRTLPLLLAAQLTHGIADVDSELALATVRAPCSVPVDAFAHVIANALGGTLLVKSAFVIAFAVTVTLVSVFRDERTLPVIAAELSHGEVTEMDRLTSQTTSPLETVIVARRGAVILVVIVAVVAACAAAPGRTSAAISVTTILIGRNAFLISGSKIRKHDALPALAERGVARSAWCAWLAYL
jgi:hypothetical protein